VTEAILLILLIPLVVLSGFFSGTETALFSLSRHQRAMMARRKTFIAQTITAMLAETRPLLITLLLGNMTVNVAYFVLTTLLAIRWQQAEVIGPAGSTGVAIAALLGIILFGEVLPKLIAARTTEQWAGVVALPLWFVHRAITPVRLFCEWFIITPLARLVSPRTTPPELDADELGELLTLSQHHGVIDADEQRLLQQVLHLSRLKVRDLMTPRVDIVAHNLDDPPSELVTRIREVGLRHIPVYRDSIDQVEGLVYARQVLLSRPETNADLENIVRVLRFVPELQRADQLLLEMRRHGFTLAIAVDEYGGTAGLITLEDVVESIVGEIPGEFDSQTEAEVEQLSERRWRVTADLPVREWADVFRQHAGSDPAAQNALEMSSTVGGLLMARLGRVPTEGDHVTIGNVQLTCESMNGVRVDSVLIELLTTTPADSEGGAA